MPYADPDQQRAFQREWMARRKDEWLKANGPCTDCGSWKDLQVDHRDPGQKVTHRVWSWAEERRVEELAKCVVRCAPCHKVKTIIELSAIVCPSGHDYWPDNADLDGEGNIKECKTCRRNRQHLSRVV